MNPVNCSSPVWAFPIVSLVTTDPFGVRVVSEIISPDNDGIFTQSGNLFKTEKTMTVLRAVANWIVDLEESTRTA
jgi:hypothetical protein